MVIFPENQTFFYESLNLNQVIVRKYNLKSKWCKYLHSNGGHSIKNLVVRRRMLRSERMKSDDGPRVVSVPLFMPPTGGIFILWAGVLAALPSALALAL